jgi:hypothetical protein
MVVAVVSEPAMKISLMFRKIDSFESERSSSGVRERERGEEQSGKCLD